MKRLVLVGGGHAHLAVLRAMANRRPSDLDLVLITPTVHPSYSGMLPGWISGHYQEADCRLDLRLLIQAAGARLIPERVVGMDAKRRCLGLSDRSRIEYDLLSVDVGSETDTSWLGALGDRLVPVKPLDEFVAAWPQVLAQARARLPYRLVVVGAGAAGIEIALAARHAFDLSAVDARVDLVSSGARMLPGHNDAVRARIRHVAAQAGINMHFARAVGVEDGVLLSDGSLLRADCVIAATGARPPAWLQLSGLSLDDSGCILVDEHQRSVSHLNVFAAGDVCARTDTPIARSGVQAVRAGRVLAANLVATLTGAPLQVYEPRQRSLYLLACGARYAVASWGEWSAEGRWVWRWKDWIDRRFVRRVSGTGWARRAPLCRRDR
jgi:pyridine nucleotide-disulfide oxidoreductase family protein